MPTDHRAELLSQIRTIRSRIDPEVLAKAELVAQAMQPGGKKPAPEPSMEPATEPYDKKAAREAVMLFLQGRHDGGKFAAKVMERMQQPEQAAKAYGRGAEAGKRRG